MDLILPSYLEPLRYFSLLCGLDGLPLVRRVWSMMADEHIREHEVTDSVTTLLVWKCPVLSGSGRGLLFGGPSGGEDLE